MPLTSEAWTWAMLMLGFGRLGFAAFSVGMKVGQIAEAAWWKGKLQEALTSTHEPPPRQISLARERQELGESLLRPGSSLLRRPPPVRRQAGPLASQHVLRDAGQGDSSVQMDGPVTCSSAVASCDRRRNFGRPCGARFTDLA
jgi:hypothetical protein